VKSFALWVALLAACGHRHTSTVDATLAPDACTALTCFQFDCSVKHAPPTSVSGIVYAPNGTLPLYGVNVYVPASDPGPLTQGVTCSRCGDGLQGGSLAAAVTDEAGHFSLTNVPATNGVPIVIQVGKWRRQLKLDTVAACQDTPIDPVDTTLPKSRTDFTPSTSGVDLPKIALSTGVADALECLPLKLGIDPTEITSSTGTGSLHLYSDTSSPGRGAGTFNATWPGGNAPMTDSAVMWGTTSTLAPYDIVMLSCEGDQYPVTKPQSSLQALHDYADVGGRIFMSHWHNIWIGGERGNAMHGLPDWQTAATWTFAGNPNPDTLTATIDEVNNPKGQSFATWMLNVMGSTTRDLITVAQARDTSSGVNAVTTERWVYLDPATSPNVTGAMNFQFTVPMQDMPADRCGKVVFSDMHVSADSSSSPAVAYPGGCAHDAMGNLKPLTAQEKALAFMFFDIASCVSNIP
jgi:hypothetical protein